MKTIIVVLLLFASSIGGALIGEKLFGDPGFAIGLIIGGALPLMVNKFIIEDEKRKNSKEKDI